MLYTISQNTKIIIAKNVRNNPTTQNLTNYQTKTKIILEIGTDPI